MTLFFVLGVILVVTALALVAMAIPAAGSRATGLDRSLAALESMRTGPVELAQDMDRPFGERVLEPLQERALTIGRRLTGADTADRFHRKLELAGNPTGWTVDRVISLKVIGAGVGLVFGLLVISVVDWGLGMKVFGLGACVAIGYFAPNFYLYQRAYDRQEAIQKELADALDLLTISVESGLAFDAALQQVAQNTDGPLAEEFARVLREMQIGQGRSMALRGLAERTNLPDLRSLVSALVQADAFGIAIAQVLRVQSGEMRVKRRQRAEEKAQQVPVKITIPLIFCILPTLFISVLGPAVISMMESFG